ncbi:MAG TPA: ATP-grasp domain-containing protein [Gaiellaceae bacterium]|nr:ATP-grasp domain-containing protein [Gaiellaceae bacterium]
MNTASGAQAGETATAAVALRPTAALVLGSDYRALAAVRSLGRRGIPVHVVADGDDRLATYSRYTRKTFEWPDDGQDRLAMLERLAKAEGETWMLLPSSDELAAFVSTHYKRLAPLLALTTPPWETFSLVYDKQRTYGLAQSVGVDVPATFYPRDRAEVEALELTYPVILKPSVKPELNRLTLAKAWRVDDRETLLRLYDEASTLLASELVMVQELIPGGGDTQLSYTALVDSGRVIRSLVARRTRQYPVDFGRASTFVETIEDPGLAEPSIRLIEAANFSGLIELEYKVDRESGRTLLLDINPRVWGWQSLCARAGVDFPWLLWLQVRGEAIPPAEATPGVRWVRLSTDLPTAIAEIARRRLSMRTYLRSVLSAQDSAIFARDDLKPAFFELPMLLGTLIRRLVSRRGV